MLAILKIRRRTSVSQPEQQSRDTDTSAESKPFDSEASDSEDNRSDIVNGKEQYKENGTENY
jgi:hypothetical protein